MFQSLFLKLSQYNFPELKKALKSYKARNQRRNVLQKMLSYYSAEWIISFLGLNQPLIFRLVASSI